MFGFQEEIRELKVQLNTLQHVEPQMMDTSILSAGSVAPSGGEFFRAGFRQGELVAGAVFENAAKFEECHKLQTTINFKIPQISKCCERAVLFLLLSYFFLLLSCFYPSF